MKIFNRTKFLTLLLIVLVQFVFVPVSKVYAATTTVNLLTTENFAILGKTSITNDPTSVINGDVGLTAGASITGLTCAEVTGTIYDSDGGFGGACRVTNAAKLTQAETDLVTAANDAAGRTPTSTLSTGDNQLGGQTLTSGVYAFGSASTANLTGTLILDGEGNSNAVWIFQASSDLVTASSSVVSLINGAQACNVFWVVSSQATLGSSSTFIGTIMAGTSVILNTSANLNGRALARTAAVTLDKNTITKPTCASTTTSSSTSTSNSTSSNSVDSYCAPIVSTVVTPIIIESKRVDKDSIYLKWGPYSGVETFNVRYGKTNGDWLYNTDVTGFTTTINALPENQPFWFQVAARNECQIGTYGESKLIGQTEAVNPNVLGVMLPNTGIGPKKNLSWNLILLESISIVLFFYSLNRDKQNNSSKH